MRTFLTASVLALAAFAAPQAWATTTTTSGSHCGGGSTPTTPPTLTNCGGSLDTGDFSYSQSYKFNYAGGENVTFALTDLLPDLVTKTQRGQTKVVTQDDTVGYFSLDRQVTREITQTVSHTVCDKWWFGMCTKSHVVTEQKTTTVTAWENVFKQLITEGSSFTTLLKDGGLYALSFVQDACNYGGKNIASNIADFLISTAYCPPISSVPVPGAALLFASSIASFGLWRRRKSA